jgi:hypothetical protein
MSGGNAGAGGNPNDGGALADVLADVDGLPEVGTSECNGMIELRCLQ